MKKGLLMVIALVAVMALLLVGCEQTSGGGSNTQQTGIWVSGEGKVKAVPDLAMLNLGIEAQEKTVQEAQTEAATTMTALVAALQSNGVAEKDIQTTTFGIEVVTKWNEDTNEQIIIGYKVTNTVTAKMRDMSKIGTIIDAAAEAGGNLTRVSSLSFTLDDPTAYYTQAREKAMQDAAAKAQQLATLAGVTLGKVIYITESGSYYIPQPIRLYDSAIGASASTPISAGELDITITVQVGYAIE
jgi:uncharacterized protein YggE